VSERTLLTSEEANALAEQARRDQLRLWRKGVAARRYERRFHRYPPRMTRTRLRSEAQKARALTQDLIIKRKISRLGAIFAGALQWIKASPHVKSMATPRGQYHHATRKGPGRRPLQPKHHVRVPTNGGKWLPRGFPRGY
jgi:hypothetical protein